MRFVSALRRQLSELNLARAPQFAHELSRGATPAVIYHPDGLHHGNFIDGSYARILARPEWAARLEKVRTAKRQARPQGAQEQTRLWRELDSASSSDALLMNIFCYPRVLLRPELTSLLGVEEGVKPVFGFHPEIKLVRSLKETTEVDMRLGSLLVEVKLTESDFTSAPLRLVERYVDFETVFERSALTVTSRGVRSYQLLRGIMAAYQHGLSFAVLADARRPDLREDWIRVMGAVRSAELRTRLRYHTWQEITERLPQMLRQFLAVKYGIIGCGKGVEGTVL